MIPVHFGVQAAPLYGVLHPAAEPRSRRGALVLGPWGWEALRAHRTLTALADRLASSGRDVFRFDYSGAGDSFGRHDDVSVEAWLEDAGHAIDELKAAAGVRRIALVGLRLGGLLAARLAATRSREIDRIVVWDPPASGDRFLEWMAEAPEGERAAFPVPDGFRRQVRDLRLAELDRFRGHLLCVGEAPSPGDDAAARSVTALAAPEEMAPCWVEDRSFGAGAVPTELLREIVAWFDA
jgi:pimeloyl-ACP methyl ester carboxylesterase